MRVNREGGGSVACICCRVATLGHHPRDLNAGGQILDQFKLIYMSGNRLTTKRVDFFACASRCLIETFKGITYRLLTRVCVCVCVDAVHLLQVLCHSACSFQRQALESVR